MDNIIIKAMTDIDERFILEAADEGHIREVFLNLTEEDGFTDDDFVNTGEDEQTDGDTAEEKQTKKKITKRTHKVSFKKILLVAVISILLFAVATTVSAYVFDFNMKEELVEFFDDHIRLHLDKVDSTADSYSLLGTDLANELEENGISPVTLPAALLTEEWSIEAEEYKDKSTTTYAIITLKNNESIYNLNIFKYKSKDYVCDNLNINNVNSGTKIETNGLDIFVFELEKAIYLTYLDGLTKYSLYTDKKHSIEELLEIAKTIG